MGGSQEILAYEVLGCLSPLAAYNTHRSGKYQNRGKEQMVTVIENAYKKN